MEAVIFICAETGFKKMTQDEAPKVTLAGLGVSFAAGYVAGASMEIWEIIEEAFQSQ